MSNSLGNVSRTWIRVRGRSKRSKDAVYASPNRELNVMRLDGKRARPWFAVRRLSMLADKNGGVRLFGSPEAAIKAATKATKGRINKKEWR